MPLFRTLSLRQLLTVPYGVLVLLLALLVGLLSYRAGRTAVDSLSEQLLGETVGCIAQAVEKHMFGSGAVLDVAFPAGITAPPRLADDVDALRTQGEGPRTLYRFSGIHGALTLPVVEEKIFDPRQRPWYAAGRTATGATWTSINIDFRTNELVATYQAVQGLMQQSVDPSRTRASKIDGPDGAAVPVACARIRDKPRSV